MLVATVTNIDHPIKLQLGKVLPNGQYVYGYRKDDHVLPIIVFGIRDGLLNGHYKEYALDGFNYDAFGNQSFQSQYKLLSGYYFYGVKTGLWDWATPKQGGRRGIVRIHDSKKIEYTNGPIRNGPGFVAISYDKEEKIVSSQFFNQWTIDQVFLVNW